MSKTGGLLPTDALAKVRLGLSVSESADLDRLGLLEEHFRLALGEIARCIVIAGGHLAYGGHLEPKGYTAFLMQEVERYSRRDETLLVCLAWPEHRRLALSALDREKRDLGLCGSIVCLDPTGKLVDPADGRGEAPEPAAEAEKAQSLTSLRRYMTTNTHGRVFIGGKQRDFDGSMPGLLEEAILAVEGSQPIYLAGGFGGVTADIARALAVNDGAWFPPLAAESAPDKRMALGITELVKVAEATGRKSLENGLTGEENAKLAASHRPSEIATLVSLGLGRRFSGKS